MPNTMLDTGYIMGKKLVTANKVSIRNLKVWKGVTEMQTKANNKTKRWHYKH